MLHLYADEEAQKTSTRCDVGKTVGACIKAGAYIEALAEEKGVNAGMIYNLLWGVMAARTGCSREAGMEMAGMAWKMGRDFLQLCQEDEAKKKSRGG